MTLKGFYAIFNSILLLRKFNVNPFKNLSISSKIFNAEMIRVLNVAEKNDAAKNIAQLMSNGRMRRREGRSVYNKIYEYDFNLFNQRCTMIMTSVSGHLLQIEFAAAYRKWNSCNPLSLFEAPILNNCPENFVGIKQTLESEIRSCSHLILWTDCDREGENIAFEIIEVCKNVKASIKIHRAKFSEITQQAVMRAVNNLVPPDQRMNDAVNVRKELDLRIGASFTRFQTLRLQKVFPDVLNNQLISYGSCQFPTLGFVVDRYKQVLSFIPEQFWKIIVSHKKDEVNTEFSWKRNRLFDHTACLVLYQICLEEPTAKVTSVKSRPKSKWRPLPLDTVELEKIASRKLQINAKEALNIAEKLYTKGFISYPRTETNMFPKELDLVNLVQMQVDDANWGAFANQVLQDGPNPRQGTKTDNAHPPIHPIKYTDSLQGNDKKIYDFVVRRFLACVSKDALGHETTVDIEINSEKFAVSGLMILAKNYLEVYPYEKWNAKEIGSYTLNETFQPTAIEMTDGETSAPDLLTEADLIALMEKHGIGTDATHSEHIETIKTRLYVGLNENNRFIPGELGMGLVEGYDLMGFHMSKPDLRAELEADLKRICDGIKDPQVVLREQVAKYREVFVEAVRQANKIDVALSSYFQLVPGNIQPESYESMSPVLKCPKCSCDVVLKKKRDDRGFYLSCLSFPQCNAALWFPECVENVSLTEEVCNQCSPSPVYRLQFKVKRGSLIPFYDDEFVACIGGCDMNLIEVLNIRPLSVGQQITSPVVNNRSNSDSGYRSSNSTTNFSFSRPGRSDNSASSSTGRPFSSWGDGFPSTERDSSNSRKVIPGKKKSNSSAAENEIVCQCSVTALKLTVRKAGSNKGRQFYKCGNDGQCSFFLWADDEDSRVPSLANGNTSVPSAPPSRSFSSNNNSDDVSCRCAIPAKLLTVNKEGDNKGKKFYACSKPRGAENCGFFQWANNEASNGPLNQAPKRSKKSESGATSKRRCGVCLETGHNRKNCPMK